MDETAKLVLELSEEYDRELIATEQAKLNVSKARVSKWVVKFSSH